MNKVLATVTPALVAGLVFASPAMAQLDVGAGADAGAGAGAGISAGTDGAGVGAGAQLDTSTTAATSAPTPDIGAAVSSLADTTAMIGSDADIKAIKVVSLDAAGQGAAETAATADEGQVQALRDVIKANTALTGALQANGIELASIMAADFDAQGNLVVFTR